MTTDLKALFDINNTSANQLAQIIQMINANAKHPLIKLHLISHFEEKKKDKNTRGCTAAIDSLLTFCFHNFEPEQINFLIEAIQPEGMKASSGLLDEFKEYMENRHSKPKPPEGLN